MKFSDDRHLVSVIHRDPMLGRGNNLADYIVLYFEGLVHFNIL